MSNGHISRTRKLWSVARSLGIRLKLNTVVCRTNIGDHAGMADLVTELGPERWKIFQVHTSYREREDCLLMTRQIWIGDAGSLYLSDIERKKMVEPPTLAGHHSAPLKAPLP